MVIFLAVFMSLFQTEAVSHATDRPDWTKRTVFQEEGNIYFTGGFLNGSDYSLSIRCANAEALKVATQSISQYIRAVFSSYIQGENTGAGGIERYVEDGIATFVNNLHVQGIRQKEVYFEEVPFGDKKLTYNVFVILEMTKADYTKAKGGVLERMKEQFKKAGEIEAKKKAEKLLDELKKELREDFSGKTNNGT
jgi:hypothetical protein